MSSPKPTVLALAAKPKLGSAARTLGEPVDEEDELILDAVNRGSEFVGKGRQRIAIMVNRVATARHIHEQLHRAYAAKPQAADLRLLTGRLRPVDRDLLVTTLWPSLCASSNLQLARPLILVTTQCLEVGADFSFRRTNYWSPALTRCARDLDGSIASAKCLSPPARFWCKSNIKPDDKLTAAEPADPIYGNATIRTWNWLSSGGANSIEMGINALQPKIDDLTASGRLSGLLAPTRDAPILLPAYIDLWSQTSPRPAMDPDVSLFLHGMPPPDEKPRMQVRVLWRNELATLSSDKWVEAVAATAPLSAEMITVSVSELRAALAQIETSADEDVEGGFEAELDDNKQETGFAEMLVWRGHKHSETASTLRGLRPDDTIILPASHSSFQALVPGPHYPPMCLTALCVGTWRTDRSLSGLAWTCFILFG